MTGCKQYSKNANIEVKGIPAEENENLKSILHKIGEQIREPVLKADVEICHDVPVSNNTVNKNIIQQFTRGVNRNEVLNKARKHSTGSRAGASEFR